MYGDTWNELCLPRRWKASKSLRNPKDASLMYASDISSIMNMEFGIKKDIVSEIEESKCP